VTLSVPNSSAGDNGLGVPCHPVGQTPAQQTDYSYDAITGGVSTITSNVTGTIHYDYDNATGQLTHTWTGANDSVHVYDDFGRLQTVSQSKLNNSSVDLTTTYTYDAVGNLDAVAQPNGVVTDYDYDGLNRLKHELVTNSNDNPLFEQDYTLLANGQRAQVIEKRYDGTSSTPFSTTRIAWTYDDEDRLTQELRDEGNDGIQNGGDYTDIYTLDLVGNRTAKEHATASGSVKTLYTYNSWDQLLTEGVDDNHNDTLDDPSEVDRRYTYDENGSTTSVTSGPPGNQTVERYVWDLRTGWWAMTPTATATPRTTAMRTMPMTPTATASASRSWARGRLCIWSIRRIPPATPRRSRRKLQPAPRRRAATCSGTTSSLNPMRPMGRCTS
jgi:YD repeat-containing protein